jgi:glycerate 2-kinase
MKIIIAPNSYKGSLSAVNAANAIERGLQRSGLGADLVKTPLADGGDGTLDAFLAHGGTRHNVLTLDPLARPFMTEYGLLTNNTAIIEMALASGLACLSRNEITPESALQASTYGTGVLLKEALENGARRFIIGMGGSATTDGGIGCLTALGVSFLDAEGRDLEPDGGSLHRLTHINVSGLDARWKDCEIIIASDVTNPAIGEQGAAHVFSPQKGAGPEEVRHLDAGLTHYFNVIHKQLGVDVRYVPGGGAAGAFAAGLMAFLGARIESGVDLILEHTRFSDDLSGADLVVTGEGRIDSQTLSGKAPFGVARKASERGVPTVALVGGLAVDDLLLREHGIAAVLPIIPYPMPLDEAIRSAATLIEQAAVRLGCLLQIRRIG